MQIRDRKKKTIISIREIWEIGKRIWGKE